MQGTKRLLELGYSSPIPNPINVLCYHLRNHEFSGTLGIGLLEYRDVIGWIRYTQAAKL